MTRKQKNFIKELLFSCRWSVLIIIPVVFFIPKLIENRLEILGVVLGLYYFLHQQKLAEAQFFQVNFKDFNERYDKLNDFLLHAVEKDQLSEVNRDKFIDYFNLCAEEYLLYEKGYIPNNVWASWVQGMSYYWSFKCVKELWLQEKVESYYGFSFERIIDGKIK